MADSLSDDVLAQQAITDVEAFTTLYRRHVKRVHNYALSRLGNEQDAQDITTQTFISALDGIESYQPRGTFGAWLIGIARYKIADHFRKHNVIVSIEEIGDLHDKQRAVDDLINQQLQIEIVSDLLSKINPERAEAIQLRFFGNLKMKEIATLMQKSEGAIKMLVSRGLDDLRQMMTRMEKIS